MSPLSGEEQDTVSDSVPRQAPWRAQLFFAQSKQKELYLAGARWFVLALVLFHFFQAVWVTTEHTGLPCEGTILACTRTLYTSMFIQWWLWNMDYHVEHHAWPAIPWSQLPALHARIAQHLDHESHGYWWLHLNVLQRKNLPDGVPLMQREKGSVAI